MQTLTFAVGALIASLLTLGVELLKTCKHRCKPLVSTSPRGVGQQSMRRVSTLVAMTKVANIQIQSYPCEEVHCQSTAAEIFEALHLSAKNNAHQQDCFHHKYR